MSEQHETQQVGALLTQEELCFFKSFGYLIKRRALDLQACSAVLDRMWPSPPDGGAFKVWPGSHRRFYPLFPMQYDQARIPFYEHLPSHKGIIHPPDYLAEVAAVEADTPPVDCYGEAGHVPISRQFAAEQRLPVSLAEQLTR